MGETCKAKNVNGEKDPLLEIVAKNAMLAVPSLLSLVGKAAPCDVSVRASEEHIQKQPEPDTNKPKRRKKKSERRIQKSAEWAARQKENLKKKEERDKINKTIPCNNILRFGKCDNGDDCSYSHDCERQKVLELCKYYVSGCCLKGDECHFLHESYPCIYFHTKGYC